MFPSTPITARTILLTDLDGTAMELLHDPTCRRIDPTFKNAFELFNQIHPWQALAVTGRDWEQVLQCNDGVAPKYPVVSSNGAQLHFPDGREVTHPFTPAETAFIAHAREQMQIFKKLHPQLVTEVKRFEIGFHNSPASGFEAVSRDIINGMAESCFAMFNKLIGKAKRENLPFRIEGTEITHKCLNHEGINKLVAMDIFGKDMPTLPKGSDWSNVIYFGDCLLYGNDREIAAEVRKRGGLVVQVINGQTDRIPDEGHEAEPHLAVNSPAELGQVLNGWVQAYRRQNVKKPALKVANFEP